MLGALIALMVLAWAWTFQHRALWQPQSALERIAAGSSARSGKPSLALSATWRGGQLTLSGALPSEELRAQVMTRAISRFGAGNVVDRLTVDAALEKEKGIEHLASFPPPLRQFTGAEARFDGATLRIGGEAESDSTRDSALEALKDSVADQYALETSVRVSALPTNAGELQAWLDRESRLVRIEFTQSGATLTPQGRSALERIAPLIKAVPNVPIAIEGHTDNTGVEAANVRLSQARAESVRTYLVRQGVEASRLTAKGIGSARPIADNNTEPGRARNRRIEFKL